MERRIGGVKAKGSKNGGFVLRLWTMFFELSSNFSRAKTRDDGNVINVYKQTRDSPIIYFFRGGIRKTYIYEREYSPICEITIRGYALRFTNV